MTCSANIIQRFFDLVPEVGYLPPRVSGQNRLGCREPVLTQYQPGSFTNAVGLTNPGAERSAELLAALRFLRTNSCSFRFSGGVSEYVSRKNLLPWRWAGAQPVLPTCERLRYGDGSGSGPGQRNRQCGERGSGHSRCRQTHTNVPNIADIAAAAIQGGADGFH